MKTLRIALVVGLCLTAAGCRLAQRHRDQTAALERHNRLLEDEIYRLRWALQDCQAGVGGTDDGFMAEPSEPSAADSDDYFLNGGRKDQAASDAPSPPTPQPDASLGEPISPDEFLRQRGATDATREDSAPAWQEPDDGIGREQLDEAPRFKPSADAEDTNHQSTPHPLDDSRDVQQLRLDPAACRGWDADGQPGDDGLIAVVQMLDAQGRPIAAPGPISLALLDPHPSLDQAAARVARWDFSAEEVAEAARRADRQGRIRLPVRWGQTGPDHERLHLFARLTTTDQRQLESDAEIQIALADGGPSHTRRAGWKPAPAEPERVAQRPSREPAAPPSRPATPKPTAPPSQALTPKPTAPPSDGSESPTPDPPPSRPKLKPPVWSPDR